MYIYQRFKGHAVKFYSKNRFVEKLSRLQFLIFLKSDFFRHKEENIS